MTQEVVSEIVFYRPGSYYPWTGEYQYELFGRPRWALLMQPIESMETCFHAIPLTRAEGDEHFLHEVAGTLQNHKHGWMLLLPSGKLYDLGHCWPYDEPGPLGFDAPGYTRLMNDPHRLSNATQVQEFLKIVRSAPGDKRQRAWLTAARRISEGAPTSIQEVIFRYLLYTPIKKTEHPGPVAVIQDYVNTRKIRPRLYEACEEIRTWL